MFFTCEIKQFISGALLEASHLNSLQNMCISLGTAKLQEQSKGIISGLHTRIAHKNDLEGIRQGSLYLEAGIFKIADNIAWLNKNIEIEKPPIGDYCLYLEKEREEVLTQSTWQVSHCSTNQVAGTALHYSIDWRPALELYSMSQREGIILTRIHNTQLEARDHWLFSENKPYELNDILRNIDLSATILLEYAEASSKGKYPTLLPAIQRYIASLVPSTDFFTPLTLWLQTGSFPLEQKKSSERRDLLETLIQSIRQQTQEHSQREPQRQRNLA